jgi:sulfur relay (sulfurtransferase) complex TusBCD TusD component (DsrE family)
MLRLLLAALLVVSAVSVTVPASASNDDPLFVNLISDEGHRVTMALTFSKGQQERGHPITVWLNDKAVLVASKKEQATYAAQQAMLAELMAKGAQVIICPLCMKHYGVSETDLIDGTKVGNPELTGNALFRDDTQTLTW